LKNKDNEESVLAVVAGWILVALGVGHTVVVLVRFKKPLAEAIRAGFVGQFVGYPDRRTAFWFMIFGPFLVMCGHIAIHAANATNRELLKIIGFYLLAISAVGCLAQPASPFWAGLVSALILIGAGYGWT
jgi:hypothetical protein